VDGISGDATDAKSCAIVIKSLKTSQLGTWVSRDRFYETLFRPKAFLDTIFILTFSTNFHPQKH
jgi:hypothetical protein